MNHTENLYPETPAPKSGGKVKWIVGAVAVLAVIGIGASLAGSTDAEDTPVAISEYEPAPHPSEQAPLVAPAPEQVEQQREAKTITRDGLFKVGTDIEPITYSYTLRNDLAYYEMCTDAMCTIAVDGSGSLLDNEMPQGDGYLTVGPEVVFVKLQGLDLTPAV